LLAERVGAQLVFLPIDGDRGLLDLNRLDEWLTPDVRLLAMTHVSNSLAPSIRWRSFASERGRRAS